MTTATLYRTNPNYIVPVENKTWSEYNKKTAGYLVSAARCYLAAAAYEEAGDNKKAYESTIQAEGILLLALTFDKGK